MTAPKKSKKHTQRKLFFEQLSSRQLLAADVAIDWDALQSQPLIAETIDTSVQFSNSGDATGFGPYVDLVVPGGQSAGLEFVNRSASILGSQLDQTIVTFDDDGNAVHPFATSDSGTPLIIQGNAGDQLVVFELPFGSYTPDQPALKIDFQLSVDADAEFGQSLEIVATGGFRYGSDASDNPREDPMLRSASSNLDVTPGIIKTSIEYLSPENETAIGENYARSYRVSFDVAEGIEVDGLNFATQLDENSFFRGIRDVSWDTDTLQLATDEVDNLSDYGRLIRFTGDTWEGVAGIDGSFLVDFHVPIANAEGDFIVDPAVGQRADLITQVIAEGNWTRSEAIEATEDTEAVPADVVNFASLPATHELHAELITAQQTVLISEDVKATNLGPGDTVQYTIDFQVSDHALFADAKLQFTLPDGQILIADSVPVLTINGLPGSDGTPEQLSIEVGQQGPYDQGQRTYAADVAAALEEAGYDSRLNGGTTDGGTGAALTGTLIYQATIEDSYRDAVVSGDASVDEGDRFVTTAHAVSSVIDPASDLATDFYAIDDSGRQETLEVKKIRTSVYAINGKTDIDENSITAGDLVTFQIDRQIRHGDIEDLVISNYLPLPVFAIEELKWVDSDDDDFKANTIRLGQRDTLHRLLDELPEPSVDSDNNRLSLTYGSIDWTRNNTRRVELLVTVRVEDQPFAEGMWLTSLANSSQGSSGGVQYSSNAAANVQYTRPVLEITKSIVASDNPSANIRDARDAGDRGTEVESIDASDIVTFEVVVENTGAGRNGAGKVVILDAIPNGFTIPESGLNLTVVDGNGEEVKYKGGSDKLFSEGIELKESIAAVGSETESNRVVLRYELQASDEIAAATETESAASVLHYTAVDNGVNYATSPIVDNAKAFFAGAEIAHTILATDLDHTEDFDVVIGETVTYRAAIKVPEGTTENAKLRLRLPQGMAIHEIVSLEISDQLQVEDGSVEDIVNSAIISGVGTSEQNVGRNVLLKFGDVINGNTGNATDEEVVIEYTAVMTNHSNSNDGVRRRTRAQWLYTGQTDSVYSDRVRVVEPKLEVAQTFDRDHVDAGDVVNVTLEVSGSEDASATAFEATLLEHLPSGFTFIPGSLQWIDGVEPSSYDTNDPALDLTWSSLATGQTSRLEYQLLVGTDVDVSSTLTSNLALAWTSVPGSPEHTIAETYHSYERTGDGNDPGATLNDYSGTASDAVRVNEVTLAGRVFVDANQDGVESIEDRGMGQVTILLEGTDHLGNAVTAETVTAATGAYQFDGLRPGTYSLIEIQPDGISDGAEHAGGMGGVVGQERIDSINIPLGTNGVIDGYRFTESPLTWIEGTVFVDANQDGNLGNDEDGIEGIEVRLFGTSDSGDAIERTVTTNSRGYYVFGHLEPGTYGIAEGVTDGYFDASEQLGSNGGVIGNDAFTQVSVDAANPGKSYNFGEYKPSSITGQIYIDYDRDQILDRKDGLIAGVEVELHGVNDLGEFITTSVDTDIDGAYSFGGLRPGTYSIESDSIPNLETWVSNTGLYLGGYSSADNNGTSVVNGFDDMIIGAGVEAIEYNVGHVDPLYDPSIQETDFDSQTTFTGTSDNDSFDVQFTTDGAIINVNGTAYTLDASHTRSIRLLGSFGGDSLQFTGSQHKEEINLRDDSARITGTWFETLVYGVENIHVAGGGNEDVARFDDTAGDETFVASAFEATMAGDGFFNSVEGIHRIYAYMTEGFDSVDLSGQVGYEDNFRSRPGESKLYGSQFYLFASGHDVTSGHATDANDRAYLYGSDGDDQLIAGENASTLVGDDYSVAVDGFGYQVVSANQGGNDTAIFQGSTGNDRLVSRPSRSTFDVGPNRIIAKAFEVVDVLSNGGSDEALIYDSHFDDQYIADEDHAKITNSVSTVDVIGFQEVNAQFVAGGTDVGQIYGTSSVDVFKASPDRWSLEGGGIYLLGNGFTNVTAYGDVDDKAYLYDSAFDDTLTLAANGGTMTGQRYSNSAFGFGKLNNEASEGNDRVVFQDGESRSTVRFNETKATIFGEGFSQNATGFDGVDAYYADLSGHDNVEIDGRIDYDLLAADIDGASFKLSLQVNGSADEVNIHDGVDSL